VMAVGMPGHAPSSGKKAVHVNIFNPSLVSLLYERRRETRKLT
jgi:hypothetical protein